MARLVSLIVLTVIIVFLGITFFQVIAPFLLPLFLAGVSALLCQPVYHYFLEKVSGRNHWAAGLTVAAVLAMILVPLSVTTFVATVELYAVVADNLEPREWKTAYRELREKVDTDGWIDSGFERFNPAPTDELDREEWETKRIKFRDDVTTKFRTNTKAALDSLIDRTLGYAASTFDFLGRLLAGVIGLMMFIIALYYFLADGPVLLQAARELIPVHQDYQQELIHRFNGVIRAVVLATFAAALGQGVATGAMLYFFVGHFFLLSVVATLTALVPLVGTWLVWGPIAIWMAVEGHWGSALFISIYGSVFVGTLDNVIRTYVLHSDAKLHPLLAFVSVLGGLQVMGLWGIFVGPTVASCLHALIQIFNTELKAFSEEKFSMIRRKKTNGDEEITSEESPAETEGSPKRLVEEQAETESTQAAAKDSQPANRRKKRSRRKQKSKRRK